MKRKNQFAIVLSIIILSPAAAWLLSTKVHSEWTWPPTIIVPLFAAAGLYALGTQGIVGSARAYRLLPTIYFSLGWLSLVIALDSPVHEIGEQLFWVHMTQHEILMLVTAPLIALGQPLVVFLRALPHGWRRQISRLGHFQALHKISSLLTAPLSAWLISAAALWIWHLPWLFDRAIRVDWIHALQHTSFFLSALLFWWPLTGKKPAMGYGAGILYLFTTALHTSVLGGLLTFAPRPWYGPYLSTAPAWHLSALEDQQLGGLIMWIPAGTLLLVVALVLLARWLNESQTRWQYSELAELAHPAEGAMR